MASCEFKFDFNGHPAELVEEIQSGFANAGGRVSVEDNAGSFSIDTPVGLFGGNFVVSERSITIEVDDKPMFVPCSAIESQLRKFVAGSKWKR